MLLSLTPEEARALYVAVYLAREFLPGSAFAALHSRHDKRWSELGATLGRMLDVHTRAVIEIRPAGRVLDNHCTSDTETNG